MAKKLQADQLTFGLLILDPDAHRIQSMRKGRKCLSCGDQFNSTHAGNRICGDCKESVLWDSPTEFSTSAAF